MWHEARRQERKIRGMLVDYRRRAERRRDYYENIRAEPTQFLQLHGRQCKIHLDQSIANTAENTVMMMWKGQVDNLIDRFDVRAHLDSLSSEEDKYYQDGLLTQEERHLNYERYRIIAQNSFLKIPEEKFLKQLHLEEQYGYTEVKLKKDNKGGVSIGFNYEENSSVGQDGFEESDDNISGSDIDVDLIIKVTKLDAAQANEMNKHGCIYGMSSNDFYSFLINDLEEAETVRLAREEEQEKALYSGRKSRRERRYHREKRLANRRLSPPSYAAKSTSSTTLRDSKSKSRSNSPSPVQSGKITYITSFGDDEEPSTRHKTSPPRSRSNDSFYNRPSTSKDNFDRRSRSRYQRCRNNIRPRYRRSTSTSSSGSSSINKSRSRYRNQKRYKKSGSNTSPSSSPGNSRSEELKNAGLHRFSSESVTNVLPRYYGRGKTNTSSDSSSALDTDPKKSKPESASKKSSTNIIIERLKRKRQVLINKQFKADKIAAQLKTARARLEQQAREDELREMSIKLRKRQREKRHANDSFTSTESNFSSKSEESDRGRGKDRRRDYYRQDRDKRRFHREKSISRDRRRREERRDRNRKRDECTSPNKTSKNEQKTGSTIIRLVSY